MKHKVLNVDIDSFSTEVEDGQCVRVSAKPDYNTMLNMLNKGYYLADRMLKVSINLQKNKCDFEKNIRMEVELVKEERESIRKIALSSFREDSRFYVSSTERETIANEIINEWVDEINEVWVCRYKENIVGFLQTKDSGDNVIEVYLAAVEEQYRISGAALSLYSAVAHEFQKRNYKGMIGYVSTKNVAVINLYTSLGGTFSNPQDIYLKR